MNGNSSHRDSAVHGMGNVHGFISELFLCVPSAPSRLCDETLI
jgi:hypothetical protein